MDILIHAASRESECVAWAWPIWVKSYFLIIDIRRSNMNDNWKLLMLPINVILIKNLVAFAIFPVKEDKEEYSIGVEICSFPQQVAMKYA